MAAPFACRTVLHRANSCNQASLKTYLQLYPNQSLQF